MRQFIGKSNEFTAIKKLVSSVGAYMIEDNCESLGAEYDSKKAGSFGLMGSFSSFFSHHISTMEGGMTVTDNEELYHILLSLRAHGWTRNLPFPNSICDYQSRDNFMESFRFILPGYNLRPLELSGAIGNEQLRKLPTLISERQKNGKFFKEKLGHHPDILIQREIGTSSWFGFSLVIREGSRLTRSLLLKRLNTLGFECRPIVAGNFTRNEVIKYYSAEIPDSLPNADLIHFNGLFIGNHHYPLTDAINLLAQNLI